MSTYVDDLNIARNLFGQTLGKISEQESFALLEEVELGDEALKTAISAIEAEFHPRHAFITPAYIRPYGIEARLQVAIIRHEKESA